MWLSPIVYSSGDVPEHLRPYYFLNPMTGVIEGFRWALLGSSDTRLVDDGGLLQCRRRAVGERSVLLPPHGILLRRHHLTQNASVSVLRMTTPAIRVENLSKQFRLGLTHAGSVRELVNRGYRRLLGRSARESTVGVATESTRRSNSNRAAPSGPSRMFHLRFSRGKWSASSARTVPVRARC